MNLALILLAGDQLVHLSSVDLAIIIFYFILVLAIGLYLKQQANTSEDFFLAGREMTAWVAGLSFLSANLGSLELMGWAAAAYQYGILAAHWYWIGAIPAMLFLGLVMMPFYYISKTHSVPGYLKLRFGESSSRPFLHFLRLHDRADERDQYVFHGTGDEGCPRMGYSRQHLDLFRHCRDLRCPRRIALGHLQRSLAVRPHLGSALSSSPSSASSRPGDGAACKPG